MHVLASMLALSLLFIGTLANAQPAADPRYSSVTIIPERGAIKPGDEITIATQIDLSNHWHVYWRNPGDSGLPTAIKWDLPEGFEISEISWPTPDKISYDTLVNYGYYNQVTLLQTLKVPNQIPQGKINLKANLEILVCNDICIPEYDEVSLSLNDPAHLNIDNSRLIDAARLKLPKPLKGQFTFLNQEGLLRLSLVPEDRTILSAVTKDNTEFFSHDWGIIKHSAPAQVVMDNGKLMIAHERGAEAIDPEKMLEGLLVIKSEIGQNKGYLLNVLPSGENIKPVIVNKSNTTAKSALARAQGNDGGLAIHETPNLTWISAIILAFFGGLILNLMPCVFPVLSIKALSLAQMKGQKAKEARLHGLAYTFGVIISFLLIAGALIALKNAGASIGWGFQFQNPLIVAVLAYLLFLIGLNLSGLFEIGTGLTNIGGKITGNHSYTGSFSTGALASIVATPCTAPFMGAAMGFALTQSALVSLSVFAVLGLGLATPYLLLSFIPAARSFLPKPGPWMETFKQFLAFPMFASSLWLIWVISQQAGTTGIFLSLFGLLFLTFAVWLAKLTKGKAPSFRTFLAKATMLFAILGVIYTLNEMRTLDTPESQQTASAKHEAIPYTKATLSDALSGSDPVFVEMTAAWCITCKINEATVINTLATRDLFKKKNVQHIIGDWTNRNNEITEYLDAYQRNGVPLYVYYGKRDPVTKMRPQSIILPQILTPSGFRNAMGSCEGDQTIFFYYPHANKKGDEPCPLE